MLVLALPVGAVAAAVLLRPHRREVVVASLRLWRQALASAPAGRRRERRIHLSWVLVLLGALLAVAAVARPTWHGTHRGRRVAVLVGASAEFLVDDGRGLTDAVRELAGRLGPNDRVQLMSPTVMTADAVWLSASEIAEGVAGRVDVLPARAEALTFPPASSEAQLTIAFVPAGVDRRAIRADTVIEVASTAPAVTIERLAAMPLDDGRVDVFATLRNHSDAPQARTVRLRTLSDDGQISSERKAELIVPPAGTADATWVVDAGDGLELTLDGEGPAALTRAYLARQEGRAIRVAPMGQDSPAVRRYIAGDPWVHVTASEADADVVVVVGAEPPADKPALVIDPSAGQPGAALSSGPVTLADADIAAGAEILAEVDFSGVALRAMPAAAAPPGATPLVSIDGHALIWSEAGHALLGDRPERIVVGFDASPANTNWTLTESFPIFMAAAVRHLAAAGEVEARYESQRPLDVGRLPAAYVRVGPEGEDGTIAGEWPAPGLYRNAETQERLAVSLTGLGGAGPSVGAAEQIAAIRLPEPTFVKVGWEFWPALVTAAAACWLAGWFAAGRWN